MAKKFTSKVSGNGLSKLMIVIILVVLALGVYAVSGVVIKEAKQRKHDALQEKLNSFSATIGERADSQGMEFDEFVSCYGIADAGLKENDEEQKAYDNMTLKNFVKFSNGSELTDSEFAEFKAAEGLADDVTIDTTDSTVKSQYVMYEQEKQNASSASDAAAGAEAGADVESDTAAEPTDAE